MRGQTGGNDSWETALLSLSFCCGHFETSGAICLAARCAGGKEEEEEEAFYLRQRRDERICGECVAVGTCEVLVGGEKRAKRTGNGVSAAAARRLKCQVIGVLAGRRSFGAVGGRDNGLTRLLGCLLAYT